MINIIIGDNIIQQEEIIDEISKNVVKLTSYKELKQASLLDSIENKVKLLEDYNGLTKNEKEELFVMLSNDQEVDLIILTTKLNKTDKLNKLKLKKFVLNKASSKQQYQYIQKIAKENNSNISSQSIEYLLKLVENDLISAITEVKKLSLFYDDINNNIINQNTFVTENQNVFNYLDFVTYKQTNKALNLINNNSDIGLLLIKSLSNYLTNINYLHSNLDLNNLPISNFAVIKAKKTKKNWPKSRIINASLVLAQTEANLKLDTDNSLELINMTIKLTN